ncbi:MAG: valine--tRNA ligase [Verrucomicrobia bacterium]|nr:valine--tRNA ligase [Verrucomicrobiota bacterium]
MAEIPKAYEPQSVEDKWYDFWQRNACFTADPARVSEKRPAYSIVIPPPNVTGVLHMGHVLNNTIQDILARKARMDGKEVLWLPGTDHAGIATQVQVERALKKEERKTKHDLGREEFLKRVWAWKEKHGGIIIQQLKKLGCSCDWTRERFTMDPEYSRCVQKVFVELYKKGLIYRGKRMVNWCPASLTALSDEEVDMESQKGFLYYFKVEVEMGSAAAPAAPVSAPLTGTLAPPDVERGAHSTAPAAGALPGPDGKIWLTIATTRPETIPGDTAIAVNPKDPRYAHLIGKHAIRPLPAELPMEKKLIPIIGDEYVDFEFGTGVLKVTPAHDKNDFEIGQRHKLAAVDIMNPNGSMNDLAGKDLAGLDRFEARKVAVEKLKELGALEKEEPYENKIGFSQRACVPIEPRLSEQWFLKYPAVEQSKACEEQEGSTPASGVAARALAGSTERVETLATAGSSVRHDAADGASAAAPGAGALPSKMRFHPQRWAKVYDHWLTNIQDWCISRQLWWGHRIPVWSLKIDGANFRDHPVRENMVENAFVLCGVEIPDGKRLSKPRVSPDSKTLERHGKTVTVSEITFEVLKTSDGFILHALTTNPSMAKELDQAGFTQDPDVLDTWFSSWLWPFATMGWTGDKSQDSKNATLQAFYPTTDLVTAPEIIFFWVARMIMAGYEFMGDLPFRNVYFTGIVRDKQGRKMSKSLGNSPDPLDLIAKYGADAIRFGTMRSAPLGQDVLFDEKDVELGRNFCNKLWNACRFRQMQGSAPAPGAAADASSAEFEIQGEIDPRLLTSDDKWILLKLNDAIREITTALAEYNFSAAVQVLYRFFWSEYCDWYVEASKAVLSRQLSEAPLTRPSATLSPSDGERDGVRGNDAARKANTLAVIDFVLSHTLRLFHPFLPFITEELWHGMGYAEDMPESQGGQTIMNAPWPKPFEGEFRDAYGLDDCYLEFANDKYEVVTQGRNLRRIGNIQSGKKVKFVLKPSREILPHDREVIRILLNAENIEINENYAAKKGTPTAHTPMGELFLPLEGLVDVEAERARLTKEKEKYEAEIVKVEQKLANPGFTQKVPPQVLLEHQQRLAGWQAKLVHVKTALESLAG